MRFTGRRMARAVHCYRSVWSLGGGSRRRFRRRVNAWASLPVKCGRARCGAGSADVTALLRLRQSSRRDSALPRRNGKSRVRGCNGDKPDTCFESANGLAEAGHPAPRAPRSWRSLAETWLIPGSAGARVLRNPGTTPRSAQDARAVMKAEVRRVVGIIALLPRTSGLDRHLSCARSPGASGSQLRLPNVGSRPSQQAFCGAPGAVAASHQGSD